MQGVFRDVVGEVSFLDRVVVSIWGKRKTTPGPNVIVIDNKPIGGGNRAYARLVRAKSTSGNAANWRYGVFTQAAWRHKLAPVQIIVKSDCVPVTCAELQTVATNVLCARYRGLVSLVELTCDIASRGLQTFGELESGIFTVAKQIDIREDPRGRKTLYVGSPRSPWQLRIYQKTNRITRFEFVFRAPFLRSIGVSAPHELLRLRNLDLTSLVKWPEERTLSILSHLVQHESGWKLRVSEELWRHSSQEVERQLRSYGVVTSGLFPESSLDRTLRRMQKRLIW